MCSGVKKLDDNLYQINVRVETTKWCLYVWDDNPVKGLAAYCTKTPPKESAHDWKRKSA